MITNKEFTAKDREEMIRSHLETIGITNYFLLAETENGQRMLARQPGKPAALLVFKILHQSPVLATQLLDMISMVQSHYLSRMAQTAVKKFEQHKDQPDSQELRNAATWLMDAFGEEQYKEIREYLNELDRANESQS